MMARMSGRYMLRVSVEGSSPRARSSMTRRSLGTESRSLYVRTCSLNLTHAVEMPTFRNADTHSSKPLPRRT